MHNGFYYKRIIYNIISMFNKTLSVAKVLQINIYKTLNH